MVLFCRLAHTALNQHDIAIECYRMALSLDNGNETYQNNLNLAEQQFRDQSTVSLNHFIY